MFHLLICYILHACSQNVNIPNFHLIRSLNLQELYLMIKETNMPKKECVFGNVLTECTRGVLFSSIICIHQWK